MDEEKIKKIVRWRLKSISDRLTNEDLIFDLHEQITKLEALLDKRTNKISSADLEEWYKL